MEPRGVWQDFAASRITQTPAQPLAPTRRQQRSRDDLPVYFFAPCHVALTAACRALAFAIEMAVPLHCAMTVVAADHAQTGSAQQKPTWLSRQIRRTRQSADGGLIDVEQPRHRALRLAGIELPERLLLLMARQLGWPTELDARLTRPLDADVSARLIRLRQRPRRLAGYSLSLSR